MTYPFEGFLNQVLKTPAPPPPPTVDADFSMFIKDAFKTSISSIPQMDENQLSNLVRNHLDSITSDILNNDPSYSVILRDRKFVSAFVRTILNSPISFETRTACNKITYDYLTCPDSDNYIKDQYIMMSKVINSDVIGALRSIGLDDNTADILALCRYSSFNEKTNVKRLNFAMYQKPVQIMTEQMIVWIYEKLFTRISDLFYATMFEVYSPEQEDIFGENFMEIYGTVGLAVLLILNNMTSINIRKVLVGYSDEWQLSRRPKTRFSLHSLSGDYSRILNVVDSLTSEGYIIP